MGKKKIGIVGAGASGLLSAILLARAGYKVSILEKNDKLGRKLLATGNGRCNISNVNINAEHFFSRSKNIASQILERFSLQRTLEFFETIGISTKELESGKLYPYSLEAKSVVKAFLYEIEHLNIEVIYGANVKKIEKKANWNLHYEYKLPKLENMDINKNSDKFKSDKKSKRSKTNRDNGENKAKFEIRNRSFDIIILCTGGMSHASSGSDGSGYLLAKSCGHSIVKPLPAIVQLVMDEKSFPYYKQLSGMKANVSLHLLADGDVLRVEEGELLFTSYGISGPPVLLLSTNVAYAQALGKKLEIIVNFFPNYKHYELKSKFEYSFNKVPHFSIEHVLEMLLPNRLVGVLLKHTKLSNSKLAGDINEEELGRILDFLGDLKLKVESPYTWEQAQVTAGGVSCNEVNISSLESKNIKGLYFAGEILDIDGDCGGFNLQWAWSSAMAVADAIVEEHKI